MPPQRASETIWQIPLVICACHWCWTHSKCLWGKMWVGVLIKGAAVHIVPMLCYRKSRNNDNGCPFIGKLGVICATLCRKCKFFCWTSHMCKFSLRSTRSRWHLPAMSGLRGIFPIRQWESFWAWLWEPKQVFWDKTWVFCYKKHARHYFNSRLG